ncbi:MAG: ABC transporter ATP-binding protein [Treponema sp.]|nr:ABC transporter ATP-binding protein [Treponema sp.]
MAFEINHLSVGLVTPHKTLPIVRDISLSVGEGEFVALVGESGSGKTMTALSAMHLLPENMQRTGGTILLNGRDISAMETKEFLKISGKEISMIFQEPMTSLNPLMKIGRQIEEAGLLHGLTREQARKKATVLAKLTGLSDTDRVLHAFPYELSGGMKQRVMIVSALMNNPSLLIADEPTTALDVSTQEEIIDILLNLKALQNVGMLLITHDLSVVQKLCSRVYVMYHGEIIESATTEELFSHPKQEYTKSLLRALPQKGIPEKPASKASDQGFSLECRNLVKAFGSKSAAIRAVDDVSLTVRKGECYGLVGESGSGKTTLGSMLCALEAPDSGKIYLNGKDISAFSRQEMLDFRKQVQIIFQDPYASLNPRHKIGTIIEEGLIIHNIGKSREERRRLVNEMRMLMALPYDVLEKYPSELSGGQRQRVAIASAMILQPKMLICDECLSSLDVLVQEQILSLLKKMQKTLNLTYLFISHNIRVVAQIADRIGVMYNGKIVEEKPASELLQNPAHPYTKTLLTLGDL